MNFCRFVIDLGLFRICNIRHEEIVIFVPVQNVHNILSTIFLSTIFLLTIFLSTIFETFKICPFFDLKGNSFVLYTKFRDLQFFICYPHFFVDVFWNFLRFFWYPQIFFSFFFSKNLEISKIFWYPQIFFQPAEFHYFWISFQGLLQCT